MEIKSDLEKKVKNWIFFYFFFQPSLEGNINRKKKIGTERREGGKISLNNNKKKSIESQLRNEHYTKTNSEKKNQKFWQFQKILPCVQISIKDLSKYFPGKDSKDV